MPGGLLRRGPVTDPGALLRIALDTAGEAGRLLASWRGDERPEVVETKSSPTDVVTEMDRRSEALITRRIPQRAPPRRGERLHLYLALAVLDRYPGAVLLGHDELDLMLRTDGHLQAAEVNPVPRWIGLPGVPRAALRAGNPRGLVGLGRLVVERLIVRSLVIFLGPVELLGIVPANVC